MARGEVIYCDLWDVSSGTPRWHLFAMMVESCAQRSVHHDERACGVVTWSYWELPPCFKQWKLHVFCPECNANMGYMAWETTNMTVIASRDRIRGDKEFEQRKQSFWSACLVFKERSSVIFLAWACWKRNKWAHWKRQASHQWTSIFRCGKKSDLPPQE